MSDSPRRMKTETIARLQRDGIAVAVSVIATTLTWFGGWIALESVAVAGALALTAASLWLLRQDRLADYLRSLVPWVAVRVAPYDDDFLRIPLELVAFGNGIAYNVMVNLFPKHPVGPALSAEPNVPQLDAGNRTEVSIGLVHHPFLGRLELRYFDPTGRQHVAWHTVNCASGRLSTTDPLNWECPRGCLVHPRSAVRF